MGERVDAVKVQVPISLWPDVVGVDRCHLDRLERLTGATLRFEPSQSAIWIQAKADLARRKARATLDRWITELATGIDAEMVLVPCAIVDDLVASEGSELVEVERVSGATCAFRMDPANPLLGLVLVRGNGECRASALRILRSRRRELLRREGVNIVGIPHGSVSALLGRSGTGMRAIQHESGARCKVNSSRGGNGSTSGSGGSGGEAFVEIRGTGLQRQLARSLLDARLRQLAQETFLAGPEESLMLFAPPFPDAGIVTLERVPEARDGFVVNTHKPHHDEHTLQQTPHFNCISTHKSKRQLHFHTQSHTEMLQHLVDRILELVQRMARRECNVLKVELSVGKQIFDLNDDYPPTQFKLPDACTSKQGEMMGSYFRNARFHDKLSKPFAERAFGRLLRDGFVLSQKECNEKGVSSGGGVEASVDIYWKSLYSKHGFITRLHRLHGKRYKFVSVMEEKYKPLTVTFLHPMAQADFRVRLTVGAKQTMSTGQISKEILALVQQLRIDEGKKNLGSIQLEYPDSMQVQHRCIRVKRKKRLLLDDKFKASLHRITQVTTVYVPRGHAEAEEEGEDAVAVPRVVESHELTFKSIALHQLLQTCAQNGDTGISGTTGRSSPTIPGVTAVFRSMGMEETVAMACLEPLPMQKQGPGGSVEVHAEIARHVQELILFGDRFTSKLGWNWDGAVEEEELELEGND